MTKSQKIVTVIISLLGAFLLWAYVITYVNPVTDVPIANIPIRILNADTLTKNGYVLTGVSNTTTTVTVSGNRSDVSGITAEDVLVTLDVGGYTEGENVIRVSVSAPANVTVKDIRNSGRVTATIEQLLTEPKPYEFLYSGSLPEGFELGYLYLDPAQMTVTGAKSLVDSVETLRVILDLSSVTRMGYAFESAVAPTSSGGTTVGNVSLSAPKLTGNVFLCEVADVPLKVTLSGELPEGFTVETEGEPTVHVRSASADFRTLEALETEPVDVSRVTESGVDVVLTPILGEVIEYAEGGGPVMARLKLVPLPEEEVYVEPEEPEDGADSERTAEP